MCSLSMYISQFSLDQILEIEHDDQQFLALQKTWESLSDKSENAKTLFIQLIVENALVSYQLAGP